MKIVNTRNGLQLEQPQHLPDLLMGLDRNLLTEVNQQRLIARPLESRAFARRSNHPRESIPHAPVPLMGQAFLPVLARAIPSACCFESLAKVRVKTLGNRAASQIRCTGPPKKQVLRDRYLNVCLAPANFPEATSRSKGTPERNVVSRNPFF